MKVKPLVYDGDLLKAGVEYLVMGIFLNWESAYYLIDSRETIRIFPCESFEIIDCKIPPNWFCKIYREDEEAYAYRRAIWGYYEFCFDEHQFEKLVDGEQEALLLYYQRKSETEKSLNEWNTLSCKNQEQKNDFYSVKISVEPATDFQAAYSIAEIWNEDRIIATVAKSHESNAFEVEIYPPIHGPFLVHYAALEQAMQVARAEIIKIT